MTAVTTISLRAELARRLSQGARQQSRADRRFCKGGRRRVDAGCVQRQRQPASALGQMTTVVPESAQRGRQPRKVWRPLQFQPGKRRAQIGLLSLELMEPQIDTRERPEMFRVPLLAERNEKSRRIGWVRETES